MLKILNQLSKKYHQNPSELNEILPKLESVFAEITDPKFSGKRQQCLNIIINIVIYNIDFAKRIYQWSFINDWLSEQICTSMIRSYVYYGFIDEGINIVAEDMIGKNITPHERTFVSLLTQPLNTSQYLKIRQLLVRFQIQPSAKLYSYLIAAMPENYPSEWFYYDIISAGECCRIMNKVVLKSEKIQNKVKTTIGSSESSFSQNNLTIKSSTPANQCNNCHNYLYPIDISIHYQNLILNSIETRYPNLLVIKYLKHKHYDVIIDGANVAYSNRSNFNFKNITKMVKYINTYWKDKKILIIFNRCRKWQISSTNLKNTDIFFSNQNLDDDISWLYAGMFYLNSWCITNDNIRDHIYYFFSSIVPKYTIDIWMERHIVNYNFSDKKALKIPPIFSHRPQINYSHVHIPISEHEWMCGKC